MKKTVCLLITGFIMFSCKKENTAMLRQMNESKLETLTTVLDSIQKQGVFNGFGVAVVTADSILYQNGFGYANKELQIEYTANTRQPIASISKTLIGIALLKAQEMGKLRLDDAVNKYLPFKVKNPKFPNTDITIRQLATHTSSINDENSIYMEKAYVLDDDDLTNQYPDYPQKFNAPSHTLALEDFLKNVFDVKHPDYNKEVYTPYRPGEYYEYSNLGASLAALVLEKATGMSYDAFTQKYILEPLGMSNSGWYGRNDDYERRSLLYAATDKPLPHYHCITYPDGGLVTSAGDMALYLQELMRGYQGKGKILSKESYKEFYTAYLNEKNFIEGNDIQNPYSDEYNSGLFIGFSPKGYIGHTGGDPGVSSLMFFDPKTGVGRFMMINTDINDKKGNDTFYAIWDRLPEAYSEKQ